MTYPSTDAMIGGLDPWLRLAFIALNAILVWKLGSRLRGERVGIIGSALLLANPITWAIQVISLAALACSFGGTLILPLILKKFQPANARLRAIILWTAAPLALQLLFYTIGVSRGVEQASLSLATILIEAVLVDQFAIMTARRIKLRSNNPSLLTRPIITRTAVSLTVILIILKIAALAILLQLTISAERL